jgi:hypothetical protein
MKKLLNGKVEESIRSRLPRGNGSGRSSSNTMEAPDTPPTEPASRLSRYRFLPAFWTITGAISLVVNIVLIAILLLTLQMLGTIQLTANDQVSGVLGQLYLNFAKMDKATISRTIPVNALVPLNINVPVKTTTRVRLAETAVIPNAHVVIDTGGVNIDADAVVTLPADNWLTIALDFPLAVQDNIPVQLAVDVNIPLSETQLHEPFTGLQQVVKPFYCIVEPNAVVDNVQICSPISPQP